MKISTRIHVALGVCSLLLLAGCLQEDSVTITKDGLVSFTSVVTEPDKEKNVEAPVFKSGIDKVLNELRQGKWKADATWLSTERPYRFKISGSGKLSEVAASTSFYKLNKMDDKKYTVSFLVPTDGKVRVTFESPKESAAVSDASGKPVHTIESASAADSYTIVLR